MLSVSYRLASGLLALLAGTSHAATLLPAGIDVGNTSAAETATDVFPPENGTSRPAAVQVGERPTVDPLSGIPLLGSMPLDIYGRFNLAWQESTRTESDGSPLARQWGVGPVLAVSWLGIRGRYVFEPEETGIPSTTAGASATQNSGEKNQQDKPSAALAFLWQLESGFNPVSGKVDAEGDSTGRANTRSASALLGNREAWVGFDGSLGRGRIGRIPSPYADAVDAWVQPLGGGRFDPTVYPLFTQQSTQRANLGSRRFDTALRYDTAPGSWSNEGDFRPAPGFSLSLAYAAGNNGTSASRSTDAAGNPVSQNTRQSSHWALALAYRKYDSEGLLWGGIPEIRLLAATQRQRNLPVAGDSFLPDASSPANTAGAEGTPVDDANLDLALAGLWLRPLAPLELGAGYQHARIHCPAYRLPGATPVITQCGLPGKAGSAGQIVPGQTLRLDTWWTTLALRLKAVRYQIGYMRFRDLRVGEIPVPDTGYGRTFISISNDLFRYRALATRTYFELFREATYDALVPGAAGNYTKKPTYYLSWGVVGEF